jgi:hypothetical protein
MIETETGIGIENANGKKIEKKTGDIESEKESENDPVLHLQHQLPLPHPKTRNSRHDGPN